MTKLKKIFLFLFGFLMLSGIWISFSLYTKILKPNTVQEGYLYIPTGSNFEDLRVLIKPFIGHEKSFIWVAKKKNYFDHIKPGKYHIPKDLNNNELINLLRSGSQTPVKLTFRSQDSFQKLAGIVSTQIEADSISLLNAFLDENYIHKSGFTPQSVLGMYIPNTYEFYWNTNAEDFRNRMHKEYTKFWNSERLQKAKNQNLTVNEVITLASIVQKETATISELPIVAGLYLNRLKYNWPLQADPTIIYALKQEFGQDLVIKRVLTKDLAIKSPYNTYKNIGLPPGPIVIPNIVSIRAVLNPTNHDYFYMCASITTIGSHEFAKTLAQHTKNAKKYRVWLSKQGVNR